MNSEYVNFSLKIVSTSYCISFIFLQKKKSIFFTCLFMNHLSNIQNYSLKAQSQKISRCEIDDFLENGVRKRRCSLLQMENSDSEDNSDGDDDQKVLSQIIWVQSFELCLERGISKKVIFIILQPSKRIKSRLKAEIHIKMILS